jgi:uncharacterized protein YukE
MAQNQVTATNEAQEELQQALRDLLTVRKQRQPSLERARAASDELREWNKKLETAANNLIAAANKLNAADVQARKPKATKARKPRAKSV